MLSFPSEDSHLSVVHLKWEKLGEFFYLIFSHFVRGMSEQGFDRPPTGTVDPGAQVEGLMLPYPSRGMFVSSSSTSTSKSNYKRVMVRRPV